MSEAHDYPYPDTIGEPDDGSDLMGLDGGEEDDGPSVEDQMAALQARLDQYEAKEQTYQQTINQLIQSRSSDQPVQQPEPEFKLDDLPDPVENPDAFKSTLQQRVRDYTTSTVDSYSQRTRAEMSQQEALQLLDRKFRERYTDLAQKELLLSSAASAEFRAAGSLDRVLQDPDSYIDKVAERMRKELGNPAPQGKPNTGRTAGVSGGSTGNRTSGGGQQKQPPGFLSQLKKAQVESGLI